jgi:hypothetical protein
MQPGPGAQLLLPRDICITGGTGPSSRQERTTLFAALISPAEDGRLSGLDSASTFMPLRQ